MLQTLTFSPSNTLNFSPGMSASVARAGAIGSDIRRLTVLCVMAEAAPAPAKAMRGPDSLYEVLRVKKDASSREIKTAYRTLAKIYHPDTGASAAARLEQSPSSLSDGRIFIEIHNAYATLSDPATRAMYDLELSAGTRKTRNPFRNFRNGSRPTRRWETDQCW